MSSNQTHFQSGVEITVNYASSFVIAWLMNHYLLPLYGYHIKPSETTSLVLIFLVVGMLRSYIVRRVFNHVQRK